MVTKSAFVLTVELKSQNICVSLSSSGRYSLFHDFLVRTDLIQNAVTIQMYIWAKCYLVRTN